MRDVDCGRERDAKVMDASGVCVAPLVSSSRVIGARKASFSAAVADPTVRVVVNGRSLLLPERLLSDAVYPLRPTTGGYVCLEDYASSVAFVLAALERWGVVTVATE